MRLRLALVLSILLSVPAIAAACGGEAACALGDRTYRVLPPDGWDGDTPLPVLLWFHGWGRQGDVPLRLEQVGGATRARGVLLVAPDGRRKSWNFRRAGTPDVEFAERVLRDVSRHYPIDRSLIMVSGFSYGSAMAWRFACDRGAGPRALFGIAGTLRQSERCAEAPAEVRHVHGTADTVMDFPMGRGGDATWAVALWRARLGCGAGRVAGDWVAAGERRFTRMVWPDCAAGGTVMLDIHAGGHLIPPGWLARQLDEVLGLPPA